MIDATDTLCIMCQKSCTNGCTWARSLDPVEGWTAVLNSRGYCVIQCPEFVKETAESILPADIDRDGMMRLLEAVALQMRQDYVSGLGVYDHHMKGMSPGEIRAANRKNIEKWLKDKGAKMLGLTNPEEVIMMLRKMARRHDTEMMQFMR